MELYTFCVFDFIKNRMQSPNCLASGKPSGAHADLYRLHTHAV